MTLQDKAQQFLQYIEQGDARCDIVTMMLCQMFNITPQVFMDKIRELAE